MSLVSSPITVLYADTIIDSIVSFFNEILTGISGVVGMLTTGMIELMLFIPTPTEIGLLEIYWNYSFPAFWSILLVTSAGFFGLMQVFPESDKADIDRFMKRFMIAIIFVFIVGNPFPGPTGFDLLIEFFNAIGSELFPDDYEVMIDISTMEGMATAAMGGISVLVFLAVSTPKILLTYGLFLAMLGMRAVIIYTTFALFPILIALWVVDIGPFAYGKMVAGFMFKATMMLLFFGLLIALILGVGGEIAGEGLTQPELDQEYEPPVNEEHPDDDRVSGGALNEENPQFSTEGMGVFTAAWFSVFVYFGSLWLCIALTSILLGGTVSPGLGKNVAKAAAYQKKAGAIRDRVEHAAGIDGSNDSDDSTVTPDVDGDSADEGMTDDSAPEPDTEDESTWESVKDSYVDAKETYSDAKETYSDAKETAAETASETASETAGKVKQKGQETSDKIEEKGSELGDDAENFSKGLTGKAANYTITSMGKIPNTIGKGLNLAKSGGNLIGRGGKAGYSVWSQNGVRDSMGEAARIARESPIAAPENPNAEDEKPKLEDDPVNIEDLDSDESFEDKGDEDATRFNRSFDLKRSYTYKDEYVGKAHSEEGEEKDMQKGYLIDDETGEEIPYVGFGDWDKSEGTKLRDGEEYEFSNVEARPYIYEEWRGNNDHDKVRENDIETGRIENSDFDRPVNYYTQVCATEHSDVERVKDNQQDKTGQ